MKTINKKGGSFELKVAKIEGQNVTLLDCNSDEEIIVSKSQLKYFQKVEVNSTIFAYVHADYNGSDRLFIYPDRNITKSIKEVVDENIRKNILEEMEHFSGEQLEKIADLIRKGYDISNLAEAARVKFWRPESQTIEYKQSFTLEEISETVVSFFNCEGGTIVLGVSDNCETIGLESNGLSEDYMRRCIINHLRQTTTGCLLFNRIRISFGVIQHHLVGLIEIPAHQGMETAYFRNKLVVRKDCTTHHLYGMDHSLWLISRLAANGNMFYSI